MGGRCTDDVPVLLGDVLEHILPLLPARAVLRAQAVSRCGSGFTSDLVGKPYTIVGGMSYHRNLLELLQFRVTAPSGLYDLSSPQGRL